MQVLLLYYVAAAVVAAVGCFLGGFVESGGDRGVEELQKQRKRRVYLWRHGLLFYCKLALL
jgi:hypothetical protein